MTDFENIVGLCRNLLGKKMSRKKKKRSIVIDKARSRQAALSVGDKLDFGNGLTTAAFDKTLDDTQKALKVYNTLLSETDQAYNSFQSFEKFLADTSDRMLTGIATQYGKNSDEYEMAGGTRKSERRRKPRSSSEQVPAAVG